MSRCTYFSADPGIVILPREDNWRCELTEDHDGEHRVFDENGWRLRGVRWAQFPVDSGVFLRFVEVFYGLDSKSARSVVTSDPSLARDTYDILYRVLYGPVKRPEGADSLEPLIVESKGLPADEIADYIAKRIEIGELR